MEAKYIMGCNVENMLHVSCQLKTDQSKVRAESVSLKPGSVWFFIEMNLKTLRKWRKYICWMTHSIFISLIVIRPE